MFVRKSVGIAKLIIVCKGVCSEEIKTPIKFVIRRAMLVQKGQYIDQDVFIYIKFYISMSRLDYIYQDLHQDLHTRKTRFAWKYTKSTKYWSTFSDADRSRTDIKIRIYASRSSHTARVSCFNPGILHERRFMSQAGRKWYFARSATRARNKALFFSSTRLAVRAKYRVRPAWLMKRLSWRLLSRRSILPKFRVLSFVLLK